MTNHTPTKRSFYVTGRPIEKFAEQGCYTDFIVAGNGRITVTCIPQGEGARARVEFTTSTQARLMDGTAFWQTWELGEVDTPTTGVASGALTAVRGYAIVGSCYIEVCRMGM